MTLEALAEYKRKKKETKAEVAKAKNATMDELYEKLDSTQGEKHVFRLAKARHKASLDLSEVRAVKDEDGKVLRDPVAVKQRWRTYFPHLLNEEFPRKERVSIPPTAGPIQPWTIEEVRKVVKKMKVGKAAGPDGVPVEVWKSLGELGLQCLTTFFNNITWSARIPQAWRDSIIVPIFKRKGDVMDCTNYRGIKLIAHTMKIYERLVDMRLRGVVEIAPDQFGAISNTPLSRISTRRQLMPFSLPVKLWKNQSGRPAGAGLPDFPYARFARMTSPCIHPSRIRIMPIFAPFPLNALPHENGLTKENYLRHSE
ncbi:hypothetical protein Y032_0179g755 [Ancylostoma ceylanicum]|uniref:Reverse transcriptase domain-containing protein n=1 Tax=Ancylostoma ceylanicum TaxID=53326 RepID=A0A016STW9_9BILA|nr:hypothetical protein Y032_0179g755 [Ancylostoma ceylanicum]